MLATPRIIKCLLITFLITQSQEMLSLQHSMHYFDMQIHGTPSLVIYASTTTAVPSCIHTYNINPATDASGIFTVETYAA